MYSRAHSKGWGTSQIDAVAKGDKNHDFVSDLIRGELKRIVLYTRLSACMHDVGRSRQICLLSLPSPRIWLVKIEKSAGQAPIQRTKPGLGAVAE